MQIACTVINFGSTCSTLHCTGLVAGNLFNVPLHSTVPAELSAPVVTAVSDISLSVTFSEPAEPNGVIILYTIYL